MSKSVGGSVLNKSSITPDDSPHESRHIRTLLCLRELLLNGEFTPGQRMAEIPLAARLGVSRTPLRIALKTLEQEGLLELHPSRGFFVRAFHLADIFDAMEMRGLLEGMAGRRAAEAVRLGGAPATQLFECLHEVVRRLDQVVGRMRRNPGKVIEEYGPLNVEFHRIVRELAHSETLNIELERVLALPFAGPSSLMNAQAQMEESRDVFRIAQDQHRSILEAITQCDLVRTENLFREHAHCARRSLQLVMANRGIHHTLPGLRLIHDEALIQRTS